MNKLKFDLRICATFLLLPLMMFSNVELSVAAKSVTPPYRITAIKAMLFYEEENRFSRDVLAKPDFVFWNAIIGEGDAEASSNSTLVIVEVSGKSLSHEPSRKVEFSATYRDYYRDARNVPVYRQVTVRRTGELDLLTHEGKSYAAFWLNNTGCDPVKITARIIGQSQPSSMSKTIAFECGE